MHDDKELYLKCECECSMMRIVREDDPMKAIFGESASESPPQWYVSLWINGYNKEKLSFRDRLRYCWHILKKGKPYEDQTIWSEEQLNELSDFIKEQLKKS